MIKRDWKWMFGLGAALLLAGCGGSGGGGGTDGGGDGGDVDRTVPTVVLGDRCEVQTVFLSGQGRRDVGSQIAVIKRVQFQNNEEDFVPSLDQYPFPYLRVQLDGYTINSRVFTVPVPIEEQFLQFTEFPLEIDSMLEIQGDGTTLELTNQRPAYVQDPPFQADLICFPGRQVTVTISLDDKILRFDPVDEIVFDQVAFETQNYDQRAQPPAIKSVISDYVSFDISNVADRPRMLDRNNQPTGPFADTVHFSGDGIAQSIGFDAQDSFQLLDPLTIENGRIKRPTIIGNDKIPGSYIIEEPDPRDINNENLRITSLQGIWRPYTDVLSNVGSYAAIAFPNSRFDDEQQFVMIQRNASGQILAMFQGVVVYNSALTGGTFRLWPVSQVDDGDPANAVEGIVSNLVVRDALTNGVLRGDYQVTSGAGPTFPFPLGGRFVVFRK